MTEYKVIVTGQSLENFDGHYTRIINPDGTFTETFKPHLYPVKKFTVPVLKKIVKNIQSTFLE